MKLSLLICSLVNRVDFRNELLASIDRQKKDGDFEVLMEIDRGEESIGHKRNKLLERSQGDYVAFIDDDDIIAKTYIKKLMGNNGYYHTLLTDLKADVAPYQG